MEEQYVKYLKALLNDKFEKVNVKKLDWLYIFEYGDKVAIKHCKVKKETIDLCLKQENYHLLLKML